MRVDPMVEWKPANPRLNSSKSSLPSLFLSRVLNWLVAYRPIRLKEGFLSKVKAVTLFPHSQMPLTVTELPLVHMCQASSIALSNFPPHDLRTLSALAVMLAALVQKWVSAATRSAEMPALAEAEARRAAENFILEKVIFFCSIFRSHV